MKKNFIVFSAIAGTAFMLNGCANCDEAVNSAKEAANNECNTKIEQLTTEWTENLEALTAERDSLLFVIDSLTAPKTASASGTKKTTTTTKPAPAPEKPKSDDARTNLKESSPKGEDARSKMKGNN